MANVDAIFEEYPFLSKVTARVKIYEAQVTLWSESFLNRTGDCYPGYPCSGIEKIYFLDEDGNTVARVGNLFKGIAGLFGFFNETVDQALARIGNEKTSTICYAVGLWRGRIILWELPKGYNNAAVWHRAIVNQARKDLLTN